MSRPRLALLANPSAGAGRAARVAGLVAERLATGAQVEVLTGHSAAESAALLAGARTGYDAVVVVGGDGTVHQALQALAEGPVPLGIVPSGTGNDVAATLGISLDPLQAADQVLAALLAGSIRSMDLARTGGGVWWATVLCSGFDSAVNERANALRWPRGPRRYDLAILLELGKLRPRRFTVTMDGAVDQFDATLVAVGNGPQYGGGKRITHGAELDDGLLQITIIDPLSRLQLVRLAPRLPTAGHIGHRKVHLFSAHEVTVSAPATTGYADGERLGPLPLSMCCVPGALRVLAPIAGSATRR